MSSTSTKTHPTCSTKTSSTFVRPSSTRRSCRSRPSSTSAGTNAPASPTRRSGPTTRYGPRVAPGGTMLLTCPIGQNTYLDQYIQDGVIDFPERHYLRRVSRDNEWREVELSEVKGTKYHSPYRNANALFVGIVPAS